MSTSRARKLANRKRRIQYRLRPRDGGRRLLLERPTDGVLMPIQLANGDVPVAVLPKTLQPPFAKLFHVPKHGRSADSHQLGGLFASIPMMQQ